MRSFLFIFILFQSLALNAFSQEKESNQDAIRWLTFEQAIKKNQEHPKKIFIDVFTKWCGWCKKMDASTFEDPAVVNYLNTNFYAVKFDAEVHDTILYNNKKYFYRPEYKANELAAYLLNGQMSYPTSVYLDEKSNSIGPVPGYLTKDQLLIVMRFFAEDLYKTVKWEDFIRDNFRQ